MNFFPPWSPACSVFLRPIRMPTNSAIAVEPQKTASDLFLLGHVVEASRLLSEAITQGETPDLWNDWAVVQLSLAERAFRRALELDPSHLDAATNLGLLLFATGRLAESAVFLQRALTTVQGPARTHIETLLAVSKAHLPVPPPSSFDREAFLARIRHVLDQYFRQGNRSPEIVTPAGQTPIIDGNPAWIDDLLKRGEVHDEDYRVFSAFRDPETTILDLGAHFGYSAASIWSTGAASHVISFEMNPGFELCLQRIAQLRPGRYDYCISGLSDSPGSLPFAIPVLNGRCVGALATAAIAPDIDHFAKVLADYFEKYFSTQPLDSFLIQVFMSPVARLDDLLATHRFSVPTDKIVAVKVDTEGLEGQVLAGARALLISQKPLILAECGHANSRLCQQLLELGYVYAQREANQLRIISAPASAINGFFLHPAHAGEYRRIGLLKS